MSINSAKKESSMTEKKIILPSDPEAASFQTVKGWINRHGQFFGMNEDSARYSGSTHAKCEGCEKTFERRGYTICEGCREDKKIAKYALRESKEWDGSNGIYSEADDQYFWDWDGVVDYCYENDCTAEGLRLLHTDPQYLSKIDEEHWADDLPEDEHTLPDEVQTALDALNAALSKADCVSYYPNQIAVKITQKQLDCIAVTGTEAA